MQNKSADAKQLKARQQGELAETRAAGRETANWKQTIMGP